MSSSIFEVLQAEEQLYAAQQALVQTQVDQLDSIVQIYRTLGGGWQQQETIGTAAVGSTTAPPAVEKTQ